MRSAEVTRAGDRSISDQLDEMRRCFDGAGIRAADLHAVRILKARVTFSATFEQAADADRFGGAFGDIENPKGPGRKRVDPTHPARG
jgi:hypothetical protein